jgi:ribonuclease R
MGEHVRRVFRIGDRVRVRVAQVSTEKKQIDFVLAEMAVQEPRVSRWKPEEYPKTPVKGKRPKSGAKKGGRRTGAGRSHKGR